MVRSTSAQAPKHRCSVQHAPLRRRIPSASHARGGYWLGLTPKCLMNNDSHRPTIHRLHQGPPDKSDRTSDTFSSAAEVTLWHCFRHCAPAQASVVTVRKPPLDWPAVGCNATMGLNAAQASIYRQIEAASLSSSCNCLLLPVSSAHLFHIPTDPFLVRDPHAIVVVRTIFSRKIHFVWQKF